MRRFKLVFALGAALIVAGAIAGPAGAETPPGRGASSAGLLNATGKVSLQDFHFVIRPMEQLSLNFVASNSPDQPGVKDPGGDVEP